MNPHTPKPKYQKEKTVDNKDQTGSRSGHYLGLNIDFEGKETDINMFIHGLSPLTTTKQLIKILRRRCQYRKLIHRKKGRRGKLQLYESVAFMTVPDQQTALDLIKRSEVINDRVVHFDVKYKSGSKMKMYKRRRLFLGNLLYKWTDKKIFMELSKYCFVRAAYSIKDPRNGRSKGYGYADFFSEGEANKLLAAAPLTIDGRKVGVKGYKNRNEARLRDRSSAGQKGKFQDKRRMHGPGDHKSYSRIDYGREDSYSNRGHPGHIQDNSQREIEYQPARNRLRDNPRNHKEEAFDTHRRELDSLEARRYYPTQNIRDPHTPNNSFRERNLRVIGLALRQRDLFKSEKGDKPIDKILESAKFDRQKNSSNLRYKKSEKPSRHLIRAEDFSRQNRVGNWNDESDSGLQDGLQSHMLEPLKKSNGENSRKNRNGPVYLRGNRNETDFKFTRETEGWHFDPSDKEFL